MELANSLRKLKRFHFHRENMMGPKLDGTNKHIQSNSSTYTVRLDNLRFARLKVVRNAVCNKLKTLFVVVLWANKF